MTDRFVAYDEQRDLSRKSFRAACYAPFHSLDFFPNGEAWVCCVNGSHTVGNIRKLTLREIWNGPKIQRLRESLVRYDWSLGCRDCENAVLRGGQPKSMRYDWPAIEGWDWPRSFSFRLSNLCNFDCIMCSDQLSSVVRSRSSLPRLPVVYRDRFFDELEEFLPHLEVIHFAGGEPCITPECFRIWDMLARTNRDRVELSMVTNASVWNDRVSEAVETLNFTNLQVSIDGVTKETFESVRRGSRFEVVMRNLDRFSAAAQRVRQRGRTTGPATLGLSYCLMPINYHEMPDVFLLAEDHGADVSVSVVLDPVSCSFLDLHPAAVHKAYAELTSRFEEIHDRLSTDNRRMYLEAAGEIKGMAGEIENGLRLPGERHPIADSSQRCTETFPVSAEGDPVRVALLCAPAGNGNRGFSRALAIARSLARCGVRVTLFYFGSESAPPVASQGNTVTVQYLDRSDLIQTPKVEAVITETGARALVAVSIDAVLAAPRVCGPLPLWLDLSENPLATSRGSTPSDLHESLAVRDWWRLAPALDRGDRFSCANEEQRLILLALLGLRGRLGENPDCSIVRAVDPDAGTHPEGVESLCDWVRELASDD